MVVVTPAELDECLGLIQSGRDGSAEAQRSWTWPETAMIVALAASIPCGRASESMPGRRAVRVRSAHSWPRIMFAAST
jgi:hypothetical protein